MIRKNFDEKIRTSFYYVQNDIISLENQQHELLERVERIERFLMRGGVQQQTQRQPQQVLEYIGNRETREIHAPDCLLARSTDARNQIIFESRQAALRSGFSECICLF